MKMGIKKLVILSLVTLTLVPIVAGVIVLGFQSKIEKSEQILIRVNEEKNIVNDLKTRIIENTLGYMDAIVDKDSFKVNDEIKDGHIKFNAYIEENKEKLKKIFDNNNGADSFDGFEKKHKVYWTSGDGLIKTIEEKKLDKIGEYDDNIDSISSEMVNQSSDIVQKLENQFIEAKLSMIDIGKKSFWVTMFSTGIAMLVSIVLGLYLVRKMNKELGEATNNLNISSGTVSSISDVFYKIGNDLSTSMQKQAEALQETMAAVEEINQTVAKNAEGAEQSESYADQCVESAKDGKQAVTSMSGTIKKIENSQKNTIEILNETNHDVEEMVTIIKNITDKTKIINDIVFQTKLLSFNASVEAARAGEMGKGFAVVAEEVGNLATMSGDAAKEINEILTNGTTKVDRIVQSMNSNIERLKQETERNINESEESVAECSNKLQDIIGKISELKMMSSQITRASKEQSIGVTEITKALNEIDQLTTNNANMAKTTAEKTNDLFSSSKNLENTVNNLKKTIDGEATLS
jgi:methyl-accepting chemotaxis protein